MNKKKIENSKEFVVESYKTLIEGSGYVPNSSELSDLGVTPKMVEYNFTNYTKLHNYMRKNHPDSFENVLDETVFTKKRFDELKKETRKVKRFIVTTAVVEKEVHTGFLNSIKNYCNRHDAMMLVLPCADVASRNRAFDWNLDPILKDENIVYNDLKLNKNLFISSIKVSAKQVNPLTGLSRIGQKHGSFIYASPKQFLEYVAESNKKKIPRALMTPGAITKPDYNTDKYMSARTSYIAESDHVLGAVVVELGEKGEFYFRQIQANPDTGSFIDLSVQYNEDGSVERALPEAIIFGDWHSGSTDKTAYEVMKELINDTDPKNIFIHDGFDGTAISHHDSGKPLVRAIKSEKKVTSLEKEIKKYAADLDELAELITDSIIIVKSNHDEHLSRYLVEGRYVFDPENHYYSLDLAKKVIEGEDALKFATEKYLKNPKRMYWLKRDDEYKIGGVECAAHGDLGANGSKGSPNSLEKAYGNCVVGHRHSAGIYRGVYHVGTMSKMQLGYNKGPSSWTHTSCLIYPNGERQLINVINGKYRA